ncbi:MAG TPA: metalloregulator ArsR/SmtB family transcription factor [Candidatus Limnocylindria bacterium]|nr:metalloregulator ArsR/SmtB family transcription factor [Candidatus Limnocylindria bacterium]
MPHLDPDVALLAALADPTRLSIVRQLAQHGRLCVCDFMECCNVSQPTISHHVKVLRQAGIVASERQGTNVYCWLTPGFAERFSAIGASLAGLVTVS